MRMRVGDWVQVKSAAEILKSLDAKGALEGMPFMPEMLAFCGQRFQIRKSAHKTCDSPNRQARHLRGVVHLDARCSGEAHGGCQAGCSLFWKEAWLTPVEGPASASGEPAQGFAEELPLSAAYTVQDLVADCISSRAGEALRYRCQATQVKEASTPLGWWDLRQYGRDLRSGNVTVREFGSGIAHALWIAMLQMRPFPGLVRYCYEHLRFLWRGLPCPRRVGSIPRGQRTPVSLLNLTPGELVRVRTVEEIDRTLDDAGENRGLYFDPEQVPYVDGTFRVLRRVDHFISEETGAMRQIKTPAVVLDSVVCSGQYSSCRIFCPRSSYLLWREAWLERVERGTPSRQTAGSQPEGGENPGRDCAASAG